MSEFRRRSRLPERVRVVRPMQTLRARSPIAGGFATVVLALFIGVMLTCIISIAIWPGEAKLLAPFLCTDARPDAVVVYDTYSPRPGETVTNFSLYCMGPRGDVTDHGWGKVFLWLSVFHTGIVLALFALGWVRRKLRAARPEPPPQGPHQLITEA